MHVPTKFHHPTFNRSQVIVLTNKQIHRRGDSAENSQFAPLRYASGK